MPRIDAAMSQIIERFNLGLNATAEEWVAALVAGALGIAAALLVHGLLYRLLTRIAQRSHSATDDIVLTHLRAPTRWSMVALGLVLAARETPVLAGVWQKIAGFVMPALIGWILLAAFRAFVEVSCTDGDGLPLTDIDTRRKRTRLAIFSRIVTFVIVFVTVGLMLFSIPGVRQIGVTLMASAGIAGLAVGAAAQPALKSLIAGLQMALTEPISIGDRVVLGDEGGTVEDIHSSFVTVQTWDGRRLIVPTSKFLEETFENWTRSSTDLLAATRLQLDLAARIPPIREAYEAFVTADTRWDKREVRVEVTEAAKDYLELRLVASVANPHDAYSLSTDAREVMLGWIRDNQPEAFAHPRTAEDPTAKPG
jgi:small-conductance mechanosensitive channel